MLVITLAIAVLAAIISTIRLGFPGLALVQLVSVMPCLWLLWRQRAAGGCLCWRGGAWFWGEAGSQVRPVELAAAPVMLPMLLQLRWRGAGDRRWRTLWLLPDSADADALRRLRRQLRLQG